MSYSLAPSQRRRAQRRGRASSSIRVPRTAARRDGLGDTFDDAVAAIQNAIANNPLSLTNIQTAIDLRVNGQAACLDQANAAVAPLDDRTNMLATTWNPTGLYTPSDLQAIVSGTLALISSATDTVSGAPRSASDADTVIANALDALYRRGQDALVYTQAIGAASGPNALVQASDLKDWVIGSMHDASQALVTAAVLDCNMPWLASAIISMQGVFDRVVSVCAAVAGAIASAVSTIYNAASTTAVAIGWALRIAPFAGAAYLAWVLFGDDIRKALRRS